MEIAELQATTKRVRKSIITMLQQAGSGHSGGSLSSVDLMVGLFFNHMKFDPHNPSSPDRDYFILSKGHGCPTLYAILNEYDCITNKELCMLRKPGSRLQGHPGSDKRIPGIEVSTGSLGYGLSIGVGTAKASKLSGRGNRTYVLMGDGEQQEGSIWEAVMAAGHYKLDNLCGIVDVNGLQIDGKVSDIMGIEPLGDKYRAFNWHVISANGHDLKSILAAYDEAKKTKGKPSVILAATVKGKGVSFMENKVDWHGKTPSQEQAVQALKEIGDQ